MKNAVKRGAMSVGLAFTLIFGCFAAKAAVPVVDIAQGPLFSGRANVHPNLLLDLSVEFPTVGAAYRGTNDYNKATEYVGYFNPKKCYTYPVISVSNTPTTTNNNSSSTSSTTSSAGGTSTTSGSSSAIVLTPTNVVGAAIVTPSAPVTTTTGTTTTGLTTSVATSTATATPTTTTTVTDAVTTVTAPVAAVWTATSTSGSYRYYSSVPAVAYTILRQSFNTTTGGFSGTTRYRCTAGTSSACPGSSSSSTSYYVSGTGVNTVIAVAGVYSHTPTTTTTVSTTTVTNVVTVSTSTLDDPDLTDANGFFSIFKDATGHECGGDSFSGNFMNWASSSSIDMLRYALTGGDRTTDTADTTVLQRAYLRDVGGTFYADGTYFPRKTVTASTTMSAPNQVTPFNTATLYVVSCRNLIFFSKTNGGGTCITTDRKSAPTTLNDPTDKYFGAFLARVKVCDSNEGATRTDLCQKYGSNYKPEGTLQQKSDKIRVGALGYLTERDTGNTNLYGGVVRGPVKYVGAKKFDAPSFAESVNNKPEWDATTGVFYNNPEDPANKTSATNSGVINYLNKFGRTNPARLGAYKGYDPVGELYYESIRYLQGLTPTGGGATTTATSQTNPFSTLGAATTDDNFPVLTTWVDPVTASCQSNYIVTIGDVNTHYDRYIPGNTRTDYLDSTRAADVVVAGKTPALDVMAWTKKVGDMEADASSSFGNSAKRSGLAALDTMNTGSSSHGTYYMAGLAYWANTNDIRLDKPVRVKTFSIDVDEGGNGSIEDTNPRGTKPRNSQFYLAAKYGGFNDKNKDGNPFKTFAADNQTVVNDNSEWASNGTDPDNYFLASNPAKMIKAIQDIFQKAVTDSGTISGVTLTTSKISTGSSYVYQPGFDTSKWAGSLLKLELKLVDQGTGDKTAPGYVPDNVVTIQKPDAATWDAGVVLTGKPATTTPVAAAVAANPVPSDRNIYTSKVQADGSLATVEFKWDSLTTDQQTLLDKSPVSPNPSDGLGGKRVDFLRGVRTDEIGQANGIFRTRDRVLGDIINSGPVYVGAPASNVIGADYKAFYDLRKGRAKAVYVGANDGMLHAFDAVDGKELFAYVPNALISSLNQLTNPNYVHRPYVDGALSVSEAYFSGGWKTILASGMGGGAQGVFVLDVTNPSDFAGAGAIWEFTDQNDPDMGNLSSPPLVAKFKTGVDATTKAPIYKYFVVIPSGLNNYKDDGASNFATTDAGVGALFLLSLDKKPKDAWELGVNYFKIKTPVKDATLSNGLSSPALVVGNDGAVRYAYAGDLQGNLWRFDFALSALSNKTLTTPLFTAMEGSNRQAITEQPKVVFAPGGGYVVLFGTGKFVETADAASANFKTQSFYGIYDTTYSAYKVSARSELAARTLAATTVSGSDGRTITGSDFTYGETTDYKKGWYMDFLSSATTGERSVTNPLVAYGKLFFNTLVTGSDPCAIGGGRTYSLDALTGLPLDSNGSSLSSASSGFLSEVGLLSSPVLFETGTEVADANATGGAKAKKKYSVFNFGTGGVKGTAAAANMNGTGTFKGEASVPAKRISWREVLNWQELHNAANKK